MPRFGIPTQPLQIPFAEGLNTKPHPFALQPPDLAVCRDAQFDQFGVLQTRKPYAPIGNSIFGGGTLTNIRRLFVNGNELCVFTDVGLYSWSPQNTAWVLRATHLAVTTDENDVCAINDDQVGCDRAVLNGVVVNAWTAVSYLSNSSVQIEARDATTGAIIFPATAVNGTPAGGSPRLVALATKILLFYGDTVNNLRVAAIDPANVSGTYNTASTVLAGGTFNPSFQYDVVKIPGQDAAIVVAKETPTTSYFVAKVTAGLTITNATKARTCDGSIAVSVDPTAAQIQVIRGNGTNVQGDQLVLSSFADSVINQALGTITTGTVTNVTCAHRSVQNSGQYRCYAFWSYTTGSELQMKSNWVDTGGSLGSQAVFVRMIDCASRAFDYNGSIYLWTLFSQATQVTGAFSGLSYQLQNSYFLYRDDGLLVAKAAAGRAGNSVVTALPGVQLVTGTTGFAWCGTVSRIVSLSTASSKGYAARSPREILFTFDDNGSRRSVRIGLTSYVAGGAGTLQYDGAGLYEVGFLVYPWSLVCTPANGSGLSDGSYNYKQTFKWTSAVGELDRSTTATIETAAIVSAPNEQMGVQGIELYNTRKSGVNAEMWRTLVNAGAGAPFYLISSQNPATSSNPNRYLLTDPTQDTLPSLTDAMSDATASGNQTNPENGAILANIAPPASKIIASNADRIFLGAIAGDPDRVWYSKSRNSGEVVAFNDSLVMNIPPTGGAIVALAFLNETLIVFRQKAIYALPGDGFANDGSGSNFGPARVISYDIGAVDAEAVATTPVGLIFKSSKGWYQLDRGWSLQYIGGQTASFDSDTVLSVDVVEAQHQIRVLTNNRTLVYDWLVKQWSEWTINNGVDAVTWQGNYVYATATNVLQEQATYAGVTYGMDVETGWIKLNDLQGFGRLRGINVLGEWRSLHTLQIRVARDYQSDGAGSWVWFDNVTWTPSPTIVGGAEQVRHPPSVQQVQAVKVRITVNPTGGADSVVLAGLGMDVAIRPEVMRRLPSSQKV